MCIILKDQSLLYAFMQFLKSQGAVYILQFCLDVGKSTFILPWSFMWKSFMSKTQTLLDFTLKTTAQNYPAYVESLSGDTCSYREWLASWAPFWPSAATRFLVDSIMIFRVLPIFTETKKVINDQFKSNPQMLCVHEVQH